jgi:uncharacterized membrane protein
MTNYFNKLNLVFTAIMFIQIAFLFIAVFMIQSNGPINPDGSKIFVYVSLFFGMLAIVVTRYLKKSIFEPARSTKEPGQKKAKYLAASIIMLAIPEAAVLISITAYWMSGEKFILGIILLLLIIGGSQKPGPNKFKIDLELSQREFDQLMQTDD